MQNQAILTDIKFRLVNVERKCIVTAIPGCRYAALSYVWGSAERLLFCAENRDRLLTPGGLNDTLGDIPRTFLDAMNIARNLGFCYLWIDALCIRQDDGNDLARHMSSMEMIYGSADLTIVSNTASVNTGIPGISCARKRPQLIYWNGDVELINAKPTFAKALTGSPWGSRGWTLQEKISPSDF
jgi:hypothetical protein